jgi:hypothetical protein
MVDLATLQFVRDTIAIVVGIAAFTYYILTVRNQNRTRQTQLFMDLYKTIASKEFQSDLEEMRFVWEYSDYDDFFDKYGVHKTPESHAKYDNACTYYSGVGVLLKNNMIDPLLVYDLLGLGAMYFWDRFESVFLEFRNRNSFPDFMGDYEYLVNRMKVIREQKGLPPLTYIGT